MKTLTDSKKRKITLEKDIAGGGEARIWTIKGQPNLVAKIYHNPTSEHEAKISAMIAEPPPQPKTHTAIAWPLDLIYDGQKFAGFLMPGIQDSVLIFQLYNPSQRNKLSSGFNWEHMHRVAYNLAIAVHAVHSVGHVIGDMNESNILVNKDKGFVTLIDTDSFQITDKKGAVYRCPVGKPEFTPPELQGINFKMTNRIKEHDLFGMGVMLFYLLMEGFHPFSGILKNTALSVGRVDLHCIQNGVFPFHKNAKALPPPKAPLFETLSPGVQKTFIQCFSRGHKNPNQRPSASEWITILEKTEKKLKKCRYIPDHVYSGHLKSCPWCKTVKPQQKNMPFTMGHQKPFTNAPSSKAGHQKGYLSHQKKVHAANPFLFIFQWIMACCLGWGLAGTIVFGLVKNDVIGWLVFGTAGGIAQWFVLNSMVSVFWIFISPLQWIIFGTMRTMIDETIISVLPELQNVLGRYHLSASIFESPYFSKIIGMGIIGLFGGIVHWFLLKNKVKKAYLWILACAIGSAAGIMLSNMTLGTYQYHILDFLGAAANRNMNKGIYWATFGAGYAMITGITLCWLIRKPKP